MRITKIELALSLGGFTMLFLALAIYARGGPVSTDVFWYANVGLNGIKDTFILNRYFHVYLEKLFIELAPNPLAGLQYFWAFLIAFTSLLIYLCARLFSKQSNVIHGVLAVLMFFSLGSIAETAGNPIVDLTAMAMGMVIVGVYLISAHFSHRYSWLIAILGLLTFLAFRTKETVIATSVLLVSLGITDGEIFNFRHFARKMIWIAVGITAGIAFMAILSGLILRDPAFGLRGSEFRQFLSTYVLGAAMAQEQPNLTNWFTAYWFGALWIPFSFYLISGIKASSVLEFSRRLVWMVPLVIIAFVIISVGDQWGYQTRFVIPALPVICFLAPQFLIFDIPNTKREQVLLALLGAGTIGAVLLVPLVMRSAVPALGMDLMLFVSKTFIPLIFVLILGFIFLSRRVTAKTNIVIGALVLATLMSPVISNFKVLFLYRPHPNLLFIEKQVYPFSSFSNQIRFSPGMRMYVSFQVWGTIGNFYYTKNIDELLSLFNIYFDANSTRDNFTYLENTSASSDDILSLEYDYVLLANNEWQLLSQDAETYSRIEEQYSAFFDDRDILALLVRR
ncbi:MAG: hypothetical protein ABIJ39_01135 [Chloroflexota bacterium]